MICLIETDRDGRGKALVQPCLTSEEKTPVLTAPADMRRLI